MLKKLLAIGALVVITATMFMVQSMTGTAYAAFAKAGDCSSVCAVAIAFDGFAKSIAKAFDAFAFAYAG
jgi:hypothetical protein